MLSRKAAKHRKSVSRRWLIGSRARSAATREAGRNAVEDPAGVGAVSTCGTMGLRREEPFCHHDHLLCRQAERAASLRAEARGIAAEIGACGDWSVKPGRAATRPTQAAAIRLASEAAHPVPATAVIRRAGGNSRGAAQPRECGSGHGRAWARANPRRDG